MAMHRRAPYLAPFCALLALTLLGCGGAAASTTPVDAAREADVGAGHTVDAGQDSGAPPVCAPNGRRCGEGGVELCRPDGSGFELMVPCVEGTRCVDEGAPRCLDLCASAAAEHSSTGCEFWATPTRNAAVPPWFSFGVAVANVEGVPSHVTVALGDDLIEERDLAPGEVAVIPLPWILELKGESPFEPARSRLVPEGAYRLRATSPIAAYQLNPIDYRESDACPSDRRDASGDCYSRSNDASLLLPVHALTGNYLAVGWPSQSFQLLGEMRRRIAPAFVSMIAVEEGITEVEVRSPALIASTEPGMPPAISPGGARTYELRLGDVLQLEVPVATACDVESQHSDGDIFYQFCRSDATHDPTGLELRATKKLAAFVGHDCAFVPSGVFACDHLEESLLPIEALGRGAVSVAPTSTSSEPRFVRIVSAANDNLVRVEPALHSNVTLDRGESIVWEASGPFRVQGSEAILVSQILVGAHYGGTTPRTSGDPSLSIEVPTEQYREAFAFYAPESFTLTRIGVVARAGEEVLLDGSPVAGLVALGSTGYATTTISVPAGAHRLRAPRGASIVVAGYGRYASYMFPGGFDLEPIHIPF